MASRRERRNRRHQEVALEPTVERVDDEKEITNFDSDVVSEVPANENVVAMHDSEDEEEDEDQDQDQNEEHRTTFASVNDLHKGCYVMMKGGFPCKVVEVARSKQGKHGSAKVSITALDIFTGRKYEDLYPSSKNVEVPEVMKIEVRFVHKKKIALTRAARGAGHREQSPRSEAAQGREAPCPRRASRRRNGREDQVAHDRASQHRGAAPVRHGKGEDRHGAREARQISAGRAPPGLVGAPDLWPTSYTNPHMAEALQLSPANLLPEDTRNS